MSQASVEPRVSLPAVPVFAKSSMPLRKRAALAVPWEPSMTWVIIRFITHAVSELMARSGVGEFSSRTFPLLSSTL